MKGQLSVDPVYKPLGIVRPTVYLKNPVVALDSHRLHFKGKSIPWDYTRGIINCTYSPQYGTLMILCDDWKLSVYNDKLQQIARLLNWQSKYTVGFEYLQQLNLLLLISVSSVQVLRMNILTNIKKTKFLSSVKFAVEKKQLLREGVQHRLKWNKGYGYDVGSGLLFVWSLQDINFYGLPRGGQVIAKDNIKASSSIKTQKSISNRIPQRQLQLKSAIRNLVKKQTPITYVYFNSSYRYTVTGLLNGNVTVWRLPLILSSTYNEIISSQYIMIHNCLYHTKHVESIVATHDDRVILSQSADLTVCLWSLQTFELLRVYDFEGEYQRVMLYGEQGALGVRDSMLGEIRFGKTMEFIMQMNNMIIAHDKTYQHNYRISTNNQIPNRITQIQLTLSSNMALHIQTDQFMQKDLNKMQVGIFYPPLKSQQIKQVISCPFITNRYYLLQQHGKIYKIRMQGLSSIIQHCYNINMTTDIENHSLNQLPTLIKFLSIIPAEYDSQIIQSAVIEKQNKLQSSSSKVDHTNGGLLSLQQRFQQLQLIAIGCNHGSVVFLKIDDMQRIYTRVTYHRQAIIAMQTVYQSQIQNSYLITICIQNHMRFVKFHHDRAICFRHIYLGQSIDFIRGFEDRLAVVLNNGLFQVMRFDVHNDDQLQGINNHNVVNHQGGILSMDVDVQREIILTAGRDNKIKIWTYYKIELYEIVLDQGLKYALFSNNYQILVSHGQKLLYIRDIPFSITKEQIQKFNSQFLSTNSTNTIKIKEFLIQSQVKKQVDLMSLSKKLINRKQNKIIGEFQNGDVNINREYNELRFKLNDSQRMQVDKGNSGRKQVSFVDKISKQVKPAVHSIITTARKTPRLSSTPTKRANSYLKQRSQTTGFSTHRDGIYYQQQKNVDTQSVSMTKKHLQEMQQLKKQTNKPLLPRIVPQKDDIFECFMREKVMKKKVLTRRDITLNRIIMKNIVKDNIGNTAESVIGLKLDF